MAFSPDNSISFEHIPYNDVESGTVFIKQENGYVPVLAQSSDFDVEINGLVADISLKQVFSNPTNEFVEAIYVFPLAEGSAVYAMDMIIGERRIKGEIKEKQVARKIYTEAKKAGKVTSLLTQQRPNMFTSKVANIAPNEEITVEIKFNQSVAFGHGQFSFRLPLTITPRFIPQPQYVMAETNSATKSSEISINAFGWGIDNDIVPDASQITPFQQRLSKHENAQQNVAIRVALSAGGALSYISSNSHAIAKQSAKILP